MMTEVEYYKKVLENAAQQLFLMYRHTYTALCSADKYDDIYDQYDADLWVESEMTSALGLQGKWVVTSRELDAILNKENPYEIYKAEISKANESEVTK